MAANSRLQLIIRELFELQKKNYEDFQPKLLPPASPSEISDLETKLGFQLPPSFREFLRLHNGWENFGAVKLFGTSDFFSTWTEQQKSYYKD